MSNLNSQFSGLPDKDLAQHQLELAQENTIPIEKIVGDINRRQEEEQTKRLAEKVSLPYLNLMNYQPEAGVVEIVPKELVETGKVFAFKKTGQNVYLAISDIHNPVTLTALEQLEGRDDYRFIPVLVSDSSMRYLTAIYGTFAPLEQTGEEISLSETQQQAAGGTIAAWRGQDSRALKVSTSELFDTVISGATYADASDIHIEPTAEKIHLRFRIDGVLQNTADLPKESLKGLISRIKILSQLKLNITDSAQDGRFSLRVGPVRYDIRVSILPTAYGESAVLRLLPQEGKFISLDALGLVSHNAPVIEGIIKQPNGLILNTGPTGSGKTTTLYAILDKINEPGKKIITIEDPIEYRLAGITQSQVNPEEGYTFATGLKSILRQDPDVILVGEIRDHDTADIAINASLTGHLVLSTLHTNDAAGAIPRLADLGLKPTYFIESILAIIAQRLVRRVCASCSEEYVPDQATWDAIQTELDHLPPTVSKPVLPKTIRRINLQKAAQCAQCHGTGYKGRLGIFEILRPNEDIVKAVLAGTTTGEIKKLAIQNGMITLKQDGLLKVLSGTTTLDEIERVTKAEE
ncbi:hypothetical protein A2V68_00735 [candidate division Kazan bacterium RBG_13_50_9]|uniref:Cytochrome c domain-containing protein n=1 Tax=candidate division Kazan bacterium RBG_13_50_9 TaxID=1798535 RepID=A0A1F4NSD1_UNCK3|nr:MAG: hypothetical protein A2V68_00735 [candidate division Kazan bacterium RBG_13_50_9]